MFPSFKKLCANSYHNYHDSDNATCVLRNPIQTTVSGDLAENLRDCLKKITDHRDAKHRNGPTGLDQLFVVSWFFVLHNVVMICPD